MPFAVPLEALANPDPFSGRFDSVLAEGRVNIEMISQGSSEINVSCVIARTDSLKALRLVHGLLEPELEKQQDMLANQLPQDPILR